MKNKKRKIWQCVRCGKWFSGSFWHEHLPEWDESFTPMCSDCSKEDRKQDPFSWYQEK